MYPFLLKLTRGLLLSTDLQEWSDRHGSDARADFAQDEAWAINTYKLAFPALRWALSAKEVRTTKWMSSLEQ